MSHQARHGGQLVQGSYFNDRFTVRQHYANKIPLLLHLRDEAKRLTRSEKRG